MQPNNQNPAPMPTNPAPTVVDVAPGQAPMQMPMAQTAAPLPAAPASKLRAIAKMTLVAVAVVVAFGGGFYASGKVTSASQANATTVAKQFVAALNAGDNAKAYALASSDMKGRQSEKEFASSMGDLKATKPKYVDQSTRFSGSTALYTLNEDGLPPTNTGTTTGKFTVALVKDGPLHWKVDAATVE